MNAAGFALDPRLAADTRPVASLPLCDVLLMNDARYPWLILVPRRAGLVEITDLYADEQAVLWQEVNRAVAALRAAAPCDKLNLGALGNIVRQLHVHVVARVEGDAAWPGPVWGHGQAAARGDNEARVLIAALQRQLANPERA
ncbi:MAG TPA: HIT family protein [Rhodanobacter sp.]|jgi:Diadenosine tetraphosphate (Ap4A) hydrolase and other HIT family hydrolases|nr:HIT family protein [Rhodanobacter sp.]